MLSILVTLAADGGDSIRIHELKSSLTTGMAAVARHARLFYISVLSQSVEGVRPEDSLAGRRQDRIVTLPTLLIPEREPHMVGLAVVPDEEADGIEAGHGPDPKPHRKVSPSMAIDAAEAVLGRVVGG